MSVVNNSTKKERIFSVSEYIEAVNIALDRFRVKVTGEVTQLEKSSKGHVYFSVKDKKGSVLNCIIWRSNYQIFGVKLEEGLEVVLSGYGNIYAPLGKLSFVAESVALKGEGLLKKAYEALKKKLTEEGLFASERKRHLPEFPQRVGVITSKYGAAINDLLSNLGKFGFKIEMADSRVEGQEAVKDILAALDVFEKREIEVLVIMRGGGSLESLQAFNNEMLVRRAVEFKAPVIAAIGHEKDVPLLSMAADVACSTPTAAAGLLNKSWEEAPLKINQCERFIFEKFSEAIFQTNQKLQQRFNAVSGNLVEVFEQFRELEQDFREHTYRIGQAITDTKKHLKDYGIRVVSGFNAQLKALVQQLYFLAKTVGANDPAKNLSLGYCIARKGGSIIKSVLGVVVGEDVDLQLKDGMINSKVNKITKKYE